MTEGGFTGGFWGFVLAIGSFAVMIFWMLVAWRAMRAHEQLAQSVDQLTRKSGREDS